MLLDKTDLSSIHQMEVREEQLEDENASEEHNRGLEESMDLPQTLSIQNAGDPRLSTFNGQGQSTLPPIKRGFNLSSLDNAAANSSFNNHINAQQLQKFDIDDDGIEDIEEIRGDNNHGGMSQTGDQVSQRSLHRGESEDQFNEEAQLSTKRRTKKGKKKKVRRQPQ